MSTLDTRSDLRFGWSALPPLPVMGLGTPLVESVEHYASRLAWTVGTNIRFLCSLPGAHEKCKPIKFLSGASSLCGPGSRFKRRIEKLEQLTGVDTIRCGSFLVLDDILSVNGIGRNSKRYRWCPQCFLEWRDDSWEPLLWIADLQLTCPLHGCDLENQCRKCGSLQCNGKIFPRRRQCQQCKTSLAGLGRVTNRPKYFRWAETKLAELVKLCATPGQEPIPFSAYETFVRELVHTRRRNRALPGTVRAAIQRIQCNAVRGRVTLRTLINLCALQGVSITEMLLDPTAAASRPLIDLWAGYRSLDFPNGVHQKKLAVYSECISEILKRCIDLYLPSMQFVTRRIKLNRDLARELCVDLYEAYEYAYQQQGAYSSRIHAERAFRQAMEVFDAPDFDPFGPCNLRKITRRVAAAANVTLAQARPITRAALYSRQALERAKTKLLDLPAERFEEGRWLKDSF